MKLPVFAKSKQKSIITEMFKISQYISAVPFVLGLTSVVVLGLLILMYSLDSNGEKLGIVNTLAQVIVAVAAVLAFVNYFESITERKNKEAVNLVTFFRDSIITIQTDITRHIKKEKGNNYVFVKLVSFDIENIEASFTKLEKSDFDKMSSLPHIEEIYYQQITLLNRLEEFALNVRLYDLEMHRALNCIWAAFTEILEINAYVISLQRTVGTSSVLYSEQLKLYKRWEKLTDRQSPEFRLNKLKEKVRATILN